MLAGRATELGTRRFAERMGGRVAAGHYEEGPGGLSLSSIGLGTYLGDADAETDAMYVRAIRAAAGLGCNVIDTAINYRYQLSERAIGVALEGLAREGIHRDELLLCTKGGFLPLDAAISTDINEYFRTVLLEPG